MSAVYDALMPLFAGERQAIAEAVASLCYANPFSPVRHELERCALGAAYREPSAATASGEANAEAVAALIKLLLAEAQVALRVDGHADPKALSLYETLVRVYLLGRSSELLEALTQACLDGGLARRRVSSFKLFEREATRLLNVGGRALPLAARLPELFAFLFQVQRARHVLAKAVTGHAPVAEALRAALWTSVFTHDSRRMERVAGAGLDAVPTLLLGGFGTDAARVARSLALARFVPFDAEVGRFVLEPLAGYRELDLASAPGAAARWLDGSAQADADPLAESAERGTLALLGIEHLEAQGQARTARLLRERAYHAAGADAPVAFTGKVIASTTCDLRAGVLDGTFREDLYYGFSADVVELPSLVLQLRQRPDDLGLLVRERLVGLVPEPECEQLAAEVELGAARDLGPRYPWPGNLQELDRCIRSVMVHGCYNPPRPSGQARTGVVGSLCRRFSDGEFNADGLLDAYCTMVYRQTGSYQEAARRLGLDRRTVKSRVDASLLAELS